MRGSIVTSLFSLKLHSQQLGSAWLRLGHRANQTCSATAGSIPCRGSASRDRLLLASLPPSRLQRSQPRPAPPRPPRSQPGAQGLADFYPADLQGAPKGRHCGRPGARQVGRRAGVERGDIRRWPALLPQPAGGWGYGLELAATWLCLVPAVYDYRLKLSSQCKIWDLSFGQP